MTAYRAVAGCPSPEDETSCLMNQTGTRGTRTLWHISLDVRQAFQATELVPSLSFTEGRMTYVGRKGHFVKEDTNWSGTALRSYKDLQGNLSVYAFDNVNSLDRTDLVQCSSTPLANTSMDPGLLGPYRRQLWCHSREWRICSVLSCGWILLVGTKLPF